MTPLAADVRDILDAFGSEGRPVADIFLLRGRFRTKTGQDLADCLWGKLIGDSRQICQLSTDLHELRKEYDGLRSQNEQLTNRVIDLEILLETS